jgi:very-short-patch-repair endonuclease
MKQYRADYQALVRSKSLRDQLTDAEIKLWQALRMNQLEGLRFRRQQAIGTYIVDFCAPRKKLIVEIDGGQHLEQQQYDAERTLFLESRGYKVLRFWNHEILNHLEDVIEAIIRASGEEEENPKNPQEPPRTPSQPPPF